ncbi:cytochrome P450 monooxygenase [Usnea florida]
MEYKLGFSSLLCLTCVIAFLVPYFSSLARLSAWLLTFSTVFPAYYILYQSWIHPFYISPLRFVPTVPGFPVWGHVLIYATEEAGVPQRRWHKQHGPIVRYFGPFGAPKLSVIDEEALKQILVKDPYHWPKPPAFKNFIGPMLGEGLVVVEGDTHIQQRKALAPGFSISSIKTLSPIFWRTAMQLSNFWHAEISEVKAQAEEKAQGSSIEVLDGLNRATLDIIGEAGFGTKFNSLTVPDTPIRVAYQRYFQFDNWGRLYHGLLTQTPLAKYLPMRAKREIMAARRTLIDIASDIIRDKQSKKLSQTLSREKDIIALVVRDHSTASGNIEGQLSFQSMRDQVMTFLGAGHDTTANGAAWTLHLLAKHRSTQDKLRREIQDYFPFLFSPNSHEREDLSRLSKIDEDNLPYLNNVCRESLRYIPTIPFVVRQNSADDHLCGYRIPAGTVTFIFTNTINRAPGFWGDSADNFDPDRWDHLPETYTPHAFTSFLYGPRGCIGRKFAETEMKTLLCCLLSMFRFEIDETVDDPEKWKMWRVVHKPMYGIKLKVSPLVSE